MRLLSCLLLLSLPAGARAEPPRRALAIVVLADNQHQGIVPVPASLGDGLDAERNLYWGARYGLRTFFRAAGWKLLGRERPAGGAVLERLLLESPGPGRRVLLLAEAWRGDRMPEALQAFLEAAAGRAGTRTLAGPDGAFGADAELVAFVGHDGLMDAPLEVLPERAPDRPAREAVVIACASRSYFAEPLRRAGARPLLWTTGLLAAEAYSLEAALRAWGRGEGGQAVRRAAARAYARYQRCSERAALGLFVSGEEQEPARP